MEASRRDLLGVAVGGLGILGAIGVLYPIVKVLSPSQASLAGRQSGSGCFSDPRASCQGCFLEGQTRLCGQATAGLSVEWQEVKRPECEAPAMTRRLRPRGGMHPSWLCAPLETTGGSESSAILCFTAPVMEGSTHHGATSLQVLHQDHYMYPLRRGRETNLSLEKKDLYRN